MARGRAELIVLCLVLLAGAVVGCVNPPASQLLTTTYELPVLNFQPRGSEGDQSDSYRYRIPRPAGDIAVRRITWELVDGSGQVLPATSHDIHLHHVLLYNTGHADMACGSTNGGLGGRWAAPGGERTPFELPDGYGYFTDANDVWSAAWHIMNLTDRPQQGVRVRYTVTYTRERGRLAPVTPYWWDHAGCGGRGTITVPGGNEPTIHHSTRTFTVRQDGLITAVRSHMHAGGIDVTLRKADGTLVCQAAATYAPPDGAGHDHGGDHGHGSDRITAIPLCQNLVRVARGDQLTSVARYRNDQRMTDAMVSNLVWIAEDRPVDVTTTIPAAGAGR
jgi:hypothetical protein